MTLVPVTGGTVTVGIDQSPKGCNPNTPRGDSWATQLVLEPVLPSAFIVSSQGQPIGNQQLVNSAEVTSTSPQTIVYTLNPKAVWSDGVPVTADDFIYAWTQQRSVVADANSIEGYRDIRSVTGSNGGHTVTVIFDSPFVDWRMLFDNLMPAHVMERVGWDPPCATVDPAVDLSAGPYEIHSVTGGLVQLVHNPRWWGPATSLDSINVKVGSSSPQLASWLASGNADVVQPSSFNAGVLAGESGHPAESTSVSISSTFLQLEFSTTGPATSEAAVRQAIAHAVDRRALVDSVVGWANSGIIPSTSHIWSQSQGPFAETTTPANMPNALDAGNEAGTTTTTGPPAASRPFPTGAQEDETSRLLTSADYTLNPAGQWVSIDGTPLSLKLAVDESDGWARSTAAALVKQLTHAQLPVTVVPEPSTTAAGMALSTGAVDMALLPMTATPYPSQAIAWYSTNLGPAGKNGSQDWSNYDSPALDALLEKAVHELNPVTGQTYYQQADQLLWANMVALPLFAEPSLFAASNQVSGAGPNANGPGLLWYPETWQVQRLEPANNTTPTTSS
jgi:peptide/nickel transport system substrate-binding protein